MNHIEQTKLTKTEWESTESPLSASEMEVLRLIERGFDNVSVRHRPVPSLLSFLKVERSDNMEAFLFGKYFATRLESLLEECGRVHAPIRHLFQLHVGGKMHFGGSGSSWSDEVATWDLRHTQCHLYAGAIVKLKSSDQIRVKQWSTIDDQANIFEFILFRHAKAMLLEWCRAKKEKKGDDVGDDDCSERRKHLFHYYTLCQLLKNNLDHLNAGVLAVVRALMHPVGNDLEDGGSVSSAIMHVIRHADAFLEDNTELLTCADLQLYEHQKQIFSSFRTALEHNRRVAKLENEERAVAKLVFYSAPTGTGKTLTPLGLAQGGYKIIFVCAARHVGLALARAAVALEKRIAFAFGCTSAADIRLHFFAAKEFTVDKRTGRMKNVDNSVGDKVDIMICDLRSYLPAMHYMRSFHGQKPMITYWDEPTISLDAETHPLHELMTRNWRENLVPNMVLSSATLPKMEELMDVVDSFREQFAAGGSVDVTVDNIVSTDFRKSVTLIDPDGFAAMPHHVRDLDTVRRMTAQIRENTTLMRYLDVKECAAFITCLCSDDAETEAEGSVRLAPLVEPAVARHVSFMEDLTMMSLKRVYLELLEAAVNQHIAAAEGGADQWAKRVDTWLAARDRRLTPVSPAAVADICGNPVANKSTSVDGAMTSAPASGAATLTRMHSVAPTLCAAAAPVPAPAATAQPGTAGIFVTTHDAYTLTDGPTLFFTNQPLKIAKFCIQQAGIPSLLAKQIMAIIAQNNVLAKRIAELELEMDKLCSGSHTENNSLRKGKQVDSADKQASRMERADRAGGSTGGLGAKLDILKTSIHTLQSQMKHAALDDLFVPNTLVHLQKWAPASADTRRAFTSHIPESALLEIMALEGIDDSWKLLLLMGIGAIAQHTTTAYTEIMKRLANDQLLYLIVADMNYLHGTNYQFCHAYLSKDMSSLTQEQLIQALGRVGRSNIQQSYTIRLRDAGFVEKLFVQLDSHAKPEVANMNRLFGGVATS